MGVWPGRAGPIDQFEAVGNLLAAIFEELGEQVHLTAFADGKERGG